MPDPASDPAADPPPPPGTGAEPAGEGARSQGELAYDRLYEAIASGLFRPGDRLREIDVAARLGLGRTPVRDALRRLEAEGVVEHRPRLGAVLRSLSHAEIVELYEMRRVLERTAAEMAAQHATPAEIDEIADLNEALLAAKGDPREAARLNACLHRCLHHAARNRFLMESTRALSNALMLLGPTTLDDGVRVETAHRQHMAIIEALRTHDAEAAGRAALEHIDTSLRHRLKALRR